MLEFKKTVLKINLYGDSVEVRFPTVGEIKRFEESEKKSEASIEVMVEFLDSLGLPKEKTNDMEIEHFTQIIEKLTNQKKS